MFETLDRLMLAGLGGLSMTRERAEKIFDEYVQRGKVEKESRSGFVKELVDATEKSRKELEKIVNEQTKKAIDQLDLATKEDVQRIESKLDQILAQCQSAE
ncbi:MAG: phasin family protein [Phycisphaerae bacterium]